MRVNEHSPVCRDSSIELLRILMMFLVVSHHYVVNSGVSQLLLDSQKPLNVVFISLWGAWGKMAINVFVLITGYFMCTQDLTARRFLKIFLEYMFYAVVIFFVLSLLGFESFSFRRMANVCFDMFSTVDIYFTASFMWFYLGIPIYNRLLSAISQREHLSMTIGLLLMFVIPSTFFRNGNVFHHVFWYMTLYFVGAIIRRSPYRWMQNNKVCVPMLVMFVAVPSLFIITSSMRLIGGIWRMRAIFMINESNRLFAFLIGLFIFLVFKNYRVPQSRVINTVAQTMFGVLCIHASSDAMRKLLWQDIFNVVGILNCSFVYVVCHAVSCTLIIMIVCGGIDLLRCKFLEKPLFNKLFSRF